MSKWLSWEEVSLRQQSKNFITVVLDHKELLTLIICSFKIEGRIIPAYSTNMFFLHLEIYDC